MDDAMPALFGFLFGLVVAGLLFLGWRDHEVHARCEATPCAVGAPMVGPRNECLCVVAAQGGLR